MEVEVKPANSRHLSQPLIMHSKSLFRIGALAQHHLSRKGHLAVQIVPKALDVPLQGQLEIACQ